MTYDPTADIEQSIRENRSVALAPRSEQEMQAMDIALLSECDDSETNVDGRDGYIAYWGTTEDGDEWTVSVGRV